jgi:hypothetical protein
MPLTASKTKIKEGNTEKDALTVTFTNGARAQLEDLREFIEAESPEDVIKLGISLVQKLKELKDRDATADANDTP